MATWGSYFSSYVKKKEEGTLIPVESPEAAVTDTIAQRTVNAGVQRPNTATKKLYGAANEDKSTEALERSASNAARVAKLFGYANTKPSLAQVVDDAVKQKAKPDSEPKPEPTLEKFRYIPITQSLTKATVTELKPEPTVEKFKYIPITQNLRKPTVTEIATPVSPQAAPEEKSDHEASYIPITSSLPKASIAETVAKMSSQAMPTRKPEAKEEMKSEPILEATQFKPVTQVSVKSLLPSLFQRTAKMTEPQARPQVPVTPEEDKVDFIPIIYSIPKDKITMGDTPSKDPKSDDLRASPTEPRKSPLPRKDSMFSQPALSRSNTQSSLDDVKPVLEKGTASSDRVLNQNSPRKHSAKLSLDELMVSLQSVPEQPKAEEIPKDAARSRPIPRSRAPKQSVDILDDIMATLRAEIVPESHSKPIAAVVVQKPVRSPPRVMTDIATELPTAVQRARRSPSSASKKRAPSPSVEEVLTEVPEPEEKGVIEVVESRAWEHARKISEFKVQQELFEKERRRMADEQLKFKEMEARFKEESEQQKMFVEDVRREQEREAAEEAERLRQERERLEADAVETARLAEEAAIMKQKAEAALERIELEKRLKEDAEKSRIAAEQEKNRLAWEAEKEKNAAEIARLIAEEEERERLEMAQLELVKIRDDQVPPTPMRERDLDEVSVYSDELVESDDDSGNRLEEEQMNEQRGREEEKLEYEREMKERSIREQREEDDRDARRRRREEQDRREQLRYEKLEAERIRAQEEEMAEDLRQFQIEDEERLKQVEEQERLRFELQQDDERRRIDEQNAQKLQFQQEQDERKAYAAAEAERQRIEDEQARIDAEEAEASARLIEEKRKPAEPFQKEQNYWAERKRLANKVAQDVQQENPGKISPRRGASEEERRTKEIEAAKQAEADEERRIEEIAARMQAEDEAAEAAATKAEELRKAEEKIKMAFASMAAQKAGGPAPAVPMKQDEVRVIGRAATFSEGPAVPAKEPPPRLIGKMGPLPIKRAGTVTATQAPAGVTRYNTVTGGTREPEKTSTSVARGNTVMGKPPAGFPRGLPSGPRAGLGLPSGPRPKRI